MKASRKDIIKPHRNADSGFTLVEMWVTVGIFLMVIAGMVYIQLFGMRLYTLAATKLSATDGCRKALNQVRDQVRQAKDLDVGTCSGFPSSFNPLGMTKYQIGNALKIYPCCATNGGVDTNNYILFYLNSSNSLVVYNTTNYGTNFSTITLANYITNQDIFAAQDYAGNILTNEDQLQSIGNRLVIYVKLQFYEWEYPIAFIGTNSSYGNMYNYYQVRTKIARRAWN